MSHYFTSLISKSTCSTTPLKRIVVTHLPQLPIIKQLLLEESIYRMSQNLENVGWVLFNDFTKIVSHTEKNLHSSIILGLSQKPKELVNVDAVLEDRIAMVRRYSGGGTVLLSPNVFMVTLILPKTFFGSQAFPTNVMRWTGRLYRRVFGSSFCLRDNDYTIDGKLKFGGNAQAFSRHGVVHHTSFLWNADYTAMSRYLQLPKRQPEYREKRHHKDFVCGISNSDAFNSKFQNPDNILTNIVDALNEECNYRHILLERVDWNDIAIDAAAFVDNFVESRSTLRAVNHIGVDGEILPLYSGPSKIQHS